MSHWEQVARVMLDLEPEQDLPADLENLLADVDSKVTLCGGSLRSRQEIAGLIAVWQRLSAGRNGGAA